MLKAIQEIIMCSCNSSFLSPFIHWFLWVAGLLLCRGDPMVRTRPGPLFPQGNAEEAEARAVCVRQGLLPGPANCTVGSHTWFNALFSASWNPFLKKRSCIFILQWCYEFCRPSWVGETPRPSECTSDSLEESVGPSTLHQPFLSYHTASFVVPQGNGRALASWPHCTPFLPFPWNLPYLAWTLVYFGVVLFLVPAPLQVVKSIRLWLVSAHLMCLVPCFYTLVKMCLSVI